MKNRFEIRGDIAVIFCRNKDKWYEVLIDKEDLLLVSAHKGTWWMGGGGRLYAGSTKTRNKVKRHILLHRYLTSAPPGMDVDHISGNPWDNRRANLRVVSHRENAQNLNHNWANNTSGYRGVSYKKKNRNWTAYYGLNKKHIYVGSFATPEAAFDAVKAARAAVMPFSPDAREAA